jgi:hypothetical protein
LPPSCILKWIKSTGRIKAGQQNCRNIRPPWFFSIYDSHTLCVTFLDICFFQHFASARCMCVRWWDYEKIQKARWKLSTVKNLSNRQLCCTYINFAVVWSVLLPFLLLYFVRWMNIYTDKKRVCFFQGC